MKIGIQIAFVVIALILIGVSYSVVNTVVKHNAIDNCSKNSSYKYASGTVTTTLPMEDAYKKCMREKGYE